MATYTSNTKYPGSCFLSVFVLGYFCAVNEEWNLCDFGLLFRVVGAMTSEKILKVNQSCQYKSSGINNVQVENTMMMMMMMMTTTMMILYDGCRPQGPLYPRNNTKNIDYTTLE